MCLEETHIFLKCFVFISRHFPDTSLGTTADHVEVEHYDPYNNTWNLTCPALKYVTNFTASACHGKLYVIGSCAVKYNALTMQCYNPVIGKDDTNKQNCMRF